MLASSMSWWPKWGRAQVAQGEAIPVPAVVLNFPRSAVQEPAIEQEAGTKQAIDVPWQVVVHNDPESHDVCDHGVSTESSLSARES
jgi:hypothetical protein